MRDVSIDRIRESTNAAILEVLRRHGVLLNGHALLASDEASDVLAGQLNNMASSGKLMVGNDRQKQKVST
jgi:hypothetical protein